MPCPLPRRTRQVRVSVASPSARPSPKFRRVGVRDFTCEACSGFTHVTACRIAQSPEATFVTRLRPGGLPLRTARQLPAQPTTRWVEPSSTGKPRRLGALSPSCRAMAGQPTRLPPCPYLSSTMLRRLPVSTIITLAVRIADEHPRAARLAHRIGAEAEELRAEPVPR